MPTILDAFPRPITVHVRGVPIAVPPLTLGGLADLQAFAREQSWCPWDVPPVDRPDLLWALVLAESDGWPPELGTPLAGLTVPDGPYADEFCHVAFGRHNGLKREESTAVGIAARLDIFPWQRILAAAYGDHPRDVASRLLNILDGAAPEERGSSTDWGLAVVSLCVEPPHYKLHEIEALSLPQFRLICRARRGTKGRVELAPERGVPPRARPGEKSKDAERRRSALVDEAKEFLEAHYATKNGAASGTDTPTESPPDGPDGGLPG